MKLKQTHNYDDILHLPHPVSKKHPPMSLSSRAAQFSPFAALTGHGAAIQETARLTDDFAEPSEDQKAHLDEQPSVLSPTGRKTAAHMWSSADR